MRLRDAKKLRNGDQVFYQGIPSKVQSLGPIIKVTPPFLMVYILLHDGRGPYDEVPHIYIKGAPPQKRRTR